MNYHDDQMITFSPFELSLKAEFFLGPKYTAWIQWSASCFVQARSILLLKKLNLGLNLDMYDSDLD